MIFREIGIYLTFALILGILSHVLGESIPRDAIRFDKFPYASYLWEDGGDIYRKLRVETWKKILPDKSRYVRTMVKKNLGEDRSSKHIKLLIEETCVAELVHWLLLFASPLFRLFPESVFGIVASILYGLSNVPFIMIQRYNRPRLVVFYRKTLVREALVYENSYPIQQ